MYSWSDNQDQYHGEFATREEAIIEGFAESDHDLIWTGENRSPNPLVGIDGEDVIERVINADDFCVDAAEGWPMRTQEQEDDLTEMLRAAFKSWMDKYNLRPTFWIVENVRQHHREDQVALAEAEENKNA